MNNNFDDLAKVALNEASFSDYMRSAKSVGRALKYGAARAVQGVARTMDVAAKDSGMKYGGQLGSIASRVGEYAKSLKELGATEAEKQILEKLYGKDPKKGDNINIELQKAGINSPNAKIVDVKTGPDNQEMYTVDLFPVISNFKAYHINASSPINKNSGDRLQRMQQAAKDKSPVDRIIFTKSKDAIGDTNVTLSFYKNNKLVPVRNLPGSINRGGLHFNGAGAPWILNFETYDTVDVTEIAAFIANDPKLKLDNNAKTAVLNAAYPSTNFYPKLKQALLKAGKTDTEYTKALSDAITSIHSGRPAPAIKQEKVPTPSKNKRKKKAPAVVTNKQEKLASIKPSLRYDTTAPSPHTGRVAGTTAKGEIYPPPSGIKL